MTGRSEQPRLQRAMTRAEAVCKARGARFTEQRRRVYELMVRAGGPVTAYELLAEMAADGGNPAPPTVYRALDFLQAHGLVHRLASQSRFVACDHPEHDHHGGLFLVCSHCGRALEWDDASVAEAVAHAAARAGYRLEEDVLPEVQGLCPHCHD